MDFFILRHAIAVEREMSDNDFERPLTTDGERKLRRVVKGIREMELSFDLILSSPYVRARQTAEIVAKSLGQEKELRLWESLGADSTPREFLAEFRALEPAPASPVVVGHEPFLSSLIALLVTGTPRSFVTFKKAGLCKLQIEAMRPGKCATMEWLLTPRHLQLIGK